MSLARGYNKSPDDLTFIIDASGNMGVGAQPYGAQVGHYAIRVQKGVAMGIAT